MKFFGNWTTFFLSAVVFLLPWQTRWMYGAVDIAGAHTEFGVMSLYVTEVLLVLGLALGIFLDRKSSTPKIALDHQLPIRFGGVLLVIAMLGTAFADRSAFSFAAVVHLAAAYLLFVAIVLDHVRLRPLLWSFVLGLVPPIVLGLLQVFGGTSPASTLLGLAARDAAQLGDAVFTVGGERVLRA